MANKHRQQPHYSSGKYKLKPQCSTAYPHQNEKIVLKLRIPNVEHGCETNGTLMHFWGKCKLVNHFGKLLAHLLKLGVCIIYNLAVLLLGIYSTKMCKHVYQKNA